MKARLALSALLSCSPVAAYCQPVETTKLTICMQQNDPPLSQRATATGFDLALASLVADHLGRALRIQWFVSRDDPDTSLAKDANALLSDGRCQLLAEYPLTKDTLDPPRAPAARLPPFDGAKPDDRRRWVQLGSLAATRPYHLDTLTVVLSPHNAGRDIRTLGDLDGLKLGVQLATMADAIAMRYADGRLQDRVVHVPDADILFDKLQDNQLDAALVDQRAFDSWRLRHRSSTLTQSGYRHSVAFNMGYAGLAANQALIDQVDLALADLQAHDMIAPLAASAGLTFTPPRAPDVLANVPAAALDGD